jgi:hypothetical protein
VLENTGTGTIRCVDFSTKLLQLIKPEKTVKFSCPGSSDVKKDPKIFKKTAL